LKATQLLSSHKNLFEDYSYIFKEQTENIIIKEKQEFVKTMTNYINPLLQFASNLGFQNWKHE